MLSVLQILITALLLALAFRRVVGKPISNLADRLVGIVPGGSQRLSIAKLHQHDAIGMLSASANSLLDAAENALKRGAGTAPKDRADGTTLPTHL